MVDLFCRTCMKRKSMFYCETVDLAVDISGSRSSRRAVDGPHLDLGVWITLSAKEGVRRSPSTLLYCRECRADTRRRWTP